MNTTQILASIVTCEIQNTKILQQHLQDTTKLHVLSTYKNALQTLVDNTAALHNTNEKINALTFICDTLLIQIQADTHATPVVESDM